MKQFVKDFDWQEGYAIATSNQVHSQSGELSQEGVISARISSPKPSGFEFSNGLHKNCYSEPFV
jgi:hypothetical protein